MKVINVISFILCVAFNGLAASGTLTGKGVGEVSDENPTLITPASYAFSIWSIIYTLLAAFTIWQCCSNQHNAKLIFSGIGPWFCATNFFNALWLVMFTIDTLWSIWLSSLVIIGLLVSLLGLYLKADLWQRADFMEGPQRWSQLLLVEVTFSIYASWVTTATILNITLALFKSGWNGGAVSPEAWCSVMLVAALMISMSVVVTKKDPVWPLVLCWGAMAISKNNQLGMVGRENTKLCAVVVSGLAAALSVTALVYRAVMTKKGPGAGAPHFVQAQAAGRPTEL
jgi:hypothetical protein